MINSLTTSEINKYYKIAFWLGIITVLYNILEGVISVVFSVADETFTLFGFGIDSFIEVLSGIGIVAMILFRSSLICTADINQKILWQEL